MHFKYIQIPIFKRNDYEAKGWEVFGYMNYCFGEPSIVEMRKRIYGEFKYGKFAGKIGLPGNGFSIWVPG